MITVESNRTASQVIRSARDVALLLQADTPDEFRDREYDEDTTSPQDEATIDYICTAYADLLLCERKITQLDHPSVGCDSERPFAGVGSHHHQASEDLVRAQEYALATSNRDHILYHISVLLNIWFSSNC